MQNHLFVLQNHSLYLQKLLICSAKSFYLLCKIILFALQNNFIRSAKLFFYSGKLFTCSANTIILSAKIFFFALQNLPYSNPKMSNLDKKNTNLYYTGSMLCF